MPQNMAALPQKEHETECIPVGPSENYILLYEDFQRQQLELDQAILSPREAWNYQRRAHEIETLSHSKKDCLPSCSHLDSRRYS
jgi:hypothetical protein